MNLLVFGLGYSAQAFVAAHRGRFGRIAATVRAPDRATALAAAGIEGLVFDGNGAADPRLPDAIAQADALLVSIPTGETGDPALEAFGDAIAAAPKLSWIGYLSTIGVYGDEGGGWVDEDTPPRPPNRRTQTRVEAEAGWLALGRRAGKATQVFRLAGIYGPGRSALDNIRDGSARRIVKPGQVFNRIHVADIAGALAASLDRPDREGMVYNVTDDEPAPPQDVVAFAAELLGVEPPPAIPFDKADLSPMGRSFYGSNKRVSNRRLRERLGYRLLYPTYREGLRSLL